MDSLLQAGLGVSQIERLLGVSHTPWMKWLAGTRTPPTYIQYSLENLVILLEKSPRAFAALLSARQPPGTRRPRTRKAGPVAIVAAALLAGISSLAPSRATAGILPLFVDAFVDGQQVFCFNTLRFRVGPVGSPPYRYDWDCAPGGGPPVADFCYEPRPRPQFQFVMYVTDRYIALTCTRTPPPPPPPPPPPGLAFRNGFEPAQ